MTDTDANLRIALAQMCSADLYEVNIETLEALAADAAAQGAHLLALPEVAGLMTRDRTAAARLVGPASNDPFLAACSRLSAAHGIWIHAGSTPVAGPKPAEDGRFLNHSAVFDETGTLRATYDKVHLFDVTLDGQAPIGESKRFAPGQTGTLLDTPWGPFGLSICYDLRFPGFFAAYGRAEATVIFVPSAFTVPTGTAHWEVLLRARAIETGAYIVASAQGGHHADGRETYGHSLLVDPWGHVLADLGEGAPQMQVVDLDMSAVARARAQIPAWRGGADVEMRRV